MDMSIWKEVIVLLGIAINAYVVLRINRVATNVQKIELATNSMQDALVKSTAKASLAEGKEFGRANALAEAEADKVKDSKP
jgi:hypothetical protein